MKEKDCIEIVQKLNESLDRFKFFLRSEEQQHNSDEFISDLTCTLAVACDSPSNENTIKILATLKGSAFFSTKIPYLLDRVQMKKAMKDPESRGQFIGCLIKVFTSYLRHLPSSYADPPYDQLKQTLEQSIVDGKDELTKKLDHFKQVRDDIIRAERARHGKRYTSTTEQKPPDDFRKIPICPTTKEIKTQEVPFLRKNIKRGRYEDVEHYLDVQFRLLREDFLEPLREGIYEITHHVSRENRNQMMKCYQQVLIVRKEFTTSGVNYEVQFDVSQFGKTNWAQSKRLIFGSFLCLSKNNFETLLFATVANRDPKDLQKGKVYIQFLEDQNVFDIEEGRDRYQMVESPAFFEAYRHVLKGLQGLNETNMPFTKYLVECCAEVNPPEYLRRESDQDPVCYDLSKALDVPKSTKAKKVPVLEPEAWPPVESLRLNTSQLEALRTAVSTEFSVIQGPPGTGKTFVGAKIVQCLLDNRWKWDPTKTSPMLMVCYTNHALDQFLEKVLEFLPKKEIIRVGGRCKSEELQACNLKLFTKKYRRRDDRDEVQGKIHKNNREMKALKAAFAKGDGYVMDFKELERFMQVQHTDQLYQAVSPPKASAIYKTVSNIFKFWLCNNERLNYLNQSANASKRTEGSEIQEGCIIPPNGTVEKAVSVDYAPFPTLEYNNTSGYFGDGFVVGFDEQSPFKSPNDNEDRRDTRNDEGTMPLFETSQPQAEKSQMTTLNLTSSFGEMKQLGPEHELSNSKTLHNDFCSSVSLKAREVTTIEITEHLEEPGHPSNLVLEKDPGDDDQFITIEEEASRLQNERCIEGDEEYELLLIPESAYVGVQEEHEGGALNGTYEDIPFEWQINSLDSSGGGQVMGRESSQSQFEVESQTLESQDEIFLAEEVSKVQSQLGKVSGMTDDEAKMVTNIWDLPEKERFRLYLYWVKCYRERLRLEIQRGEQKHEELCAKWKIMSCQEEEEVICRATVVGMTTSGAARYHSMLQRIAPKIVIIEEAAEVMEAHIITSLARDTKHTILIGDHKQLRPKPTVHQLAQEYNLEISLFERMVLNDMECKRLAIQHRMRPEIAALTKRIYEHEIIDHESVCKFDHISGLRHNLFFLNHSQPESPVRGLQSFSNPHEADFLVALCRYLLLQGYKRAQITILTMYAGQLLELKNKLPREEFEGVKLCVVDNFQGEENDIILLSLVRSNTKIGFLKESNRICVALSRARQGFYCIGNFGLLRSKSPLWKEICDDLETKNAVGQTLPLVCKRHDRCNEVRNGRDFQKFPLGGCDRVCGDRLDCGHACDRKCHSTDEYHKFGRCPKMCLKTCSNEHQCKRRCHGSFDCLCPHPVLKIIPKCGHEQIVQCHVNPEEFVCLMKCERKLDCGHDCAEVCGNLCTRNCKVLCRKSLPCEHEKNLLCYQDPMLYKKCNKRCSKILECGHPCSKKCYEICFCNTTIDLELPCKHSVRILCSTQHNPPHCVEDCCRELLCGHKCPGPCCEDCSQYQCKTLVDKLLSCGHKKTIPCYMNPHDAKCQEACQKKCSRGHPCQQQCHFGSPCKDCRVKIDMTIPSCGHFIEMPCFCDPAAFICKKPCERLRLCGHPCRDFCGKNCEMRPCMKLVQRKLPCRHSITLACHKNPETYKCKENVLVDLPCEHRKSMKCYALYAGIQNVLCHEKVERNLPCRHKIVLSCHTNPDMYKCKEKVEVKLKCGHVIVATCSFATVVEQEFKCTVLTKRTLPCEHEVNIPCCTSSQEYSCQERVDVTLSCKHKKHVECSKLTDGLENVKCEEVVTKALPCGHEKEMPCFTRAEEVSCNLPCRRVLSCEHPCRGRCSDDCSKLACTERVQKSLACGYHQLKCLCSEDVSEVDCTQKCERKLPCGHYCNGKCFEICGKYKCEEMVLKELDCPQKHTRRMPCHRDPRSVLCLKKCTKKLDCGHPCEGACGKPCESVKCMRKMKHTFPCRHTTRVSCFERKTAICRAPCPRQKSSCQHLCKGLCGKPCDGYPCQEVVIKRLRCGHKIKMHCCDNPEKVPCPVVCGKIMQCGHQCFGICGNCQRRRSHEICKTQCSRVLVCLHRCKAPCYLPCPPCVGTCSRMCPHDKCTQPCSTPCEPCRQPCTLSCPHGRCNNLCGEECERFSCNAPCPKTLRCGHQCIGLCGEDCPTLCAICNAKSLSIKSTDGRANNTEAPRYLQLFDCGHIIKVKDMDEWMVQQLGNNVQLMRCPKCSTVITFSYRYGHIIKRTLKNVENVKAKIQKLAYDVVYSIQHTKRDLRRLNYDVRKLKFPQTVFRLSHSYPCSMHDMLLIFTLKNHLTILYQAQATERVIAEMQQADACIKQQPGLDHQFTIITDALGKIKAYLEQPQLHLKILSRLHDRTRKFSLFSRVLEVQSKATLHQIPWSSGGTHRLKKARDRFELFLQGKDDALDLEWLKKIVSLLRSEVNLPDLPAEEAKDFVNFPGYQRGVWKLCKKGHVYYTGLLVREGKDILIGSEGCTQCIASESDQTV